MEFEKVVLINLIQNEPYLRKVFPYIAREYFSEQSRQIVFSLIKAHTERYNSAPKKQQLMLYLDKSRFRQNIYDASVTELDNIFNQSETPTDQLDWLVDETEKWVKESAINNAVRESITIIEEERNDKGRRTRNEIPEIMRKALSVSFDPTVGHDYIDDAEKRYDFYHNVETRIPFDLEYLNLITGGGLPDKTLNIIIGDTGAGKTRIMCHMAGANLMDGKNVLYITAEMAEERIAERIDANLMGIAVDDIPMVEKNVWDRKIAELDAKTVGKLVIKEYPTSCASILHIQALMDELRLKRKFIPDIIYIDYLNIMNSSKLKMSNSVNSYILIKSIAEELRQLAVEMCVPIISATQTNRDGFGKKDIGLDNTAESFGLPMTADFMFALITTDELKSRNRIGIRQLKNRYRDLEQNKTGLIGVKNSEFKLFDVEDEDPDTELPGAEEVDYPLPSKFRDDTPGVF